MPRNTTTDRDSPSIFRVATVPTNASGMVSMMISGRRSELNCAVSSRTMTSRPISRPIMPLAAIHISGHLASTNSLGLATLGYDRESADPDGGRLRRDESGALDGVLEETAMESLTEKLAEPSS